MSLHSSIFTALSTTAGVTALIGAGDDCRAYVNQVPDGVARPYVRWQHIASDPQATHGEPVGIQHDLVQFECYAETFAAAHALRAAVIAALDDVELAGGENPTLQDTRDSYEEAVELHRCDADLMI